MGDPDACPPVIHKYSRDFSGFARDGAGNFGLTNGSPGYVQGYRIAGYGARRQFCGIQDQRMGAEAHQPGRAPGMHEAARVKAAGCRRAPLLKIQALRQGLLDTRPGWGSSASVQDLLPPELRGSQSCGGQGCGGQGCGGQVSYRSKVAGVRSRIVACHKAGPDPFDIAFPLPSPRLQRDPVDDADLYENPSGPHQSGLCWRLRLRQDPPGTPHR